MEKKLPNSIIIKKNSIVKVDFSSGMIIRLQQAQAYFMNNTSKEQIEKFNEEVKKYDGIIKNTSTFSEEWMSVFITITLLLLDIQKHAEEQNLTEEVDTENTLKEIINSLTTDDNSPADQSQSQPE